MHHRRFLGSGCPFFRTRYFAIRSGCPSANRILGDWPFPNHFREALLWKRGLVRQVIGFVSYVVVGKGRGSAARPFRAQLVQRFWRFSCQDLPWGLYYFRLARHSDSEEQLALPSVRFSCLLLEATPYGYRAAILRMPCNLDASSSIPISSSAW